MVDNQLAVDRKWLGINGSAAYRAIPMFLNDFYKMRRFFLEPEVGLSDPYESLPIWNIVWFCDLRQAVLQSGFQMLYLIKSQSLILKKEVNTEKLQIKGTGRTLKVKKRSSDKEN